MSTRHEDTEELLKKRIDYWMNIYKDTRDLYMRNRALTHADKAAHGLQELRRLQELTRK